jgi:hypothetical protein
LPVFLNLAVLKKLLGVYVALVRLSDIKQSGYGLVVHFIVHREYRSVTETVDRACGAINKAPFVVTLHW